MQQPDRRQPGESPEEFLTRSRTEITHVLEALCRQQVPVRANMDNGRSLDEALFVTRVRAVDAQAGRFIVDYSDHKAANLRLLGRAKVALHADLERSHVLFAGLQPAHVLAEGRIGVRFGYPEYLVKHAQRMQPRVRIPPELKLQCFVECPGILPFEMEVVDISLEGQGMMLTDPNVRLEPGMVIRGCKILYPGRRPVSVDLEIRYAQPDARAQPDERRRVGARFVGERADVADLVRLFSVELDRLK